MSEFIVLSEQDVQQVLDAKTCNDLVETAFRLQGQGRAGNLPSVSHRTPDGRCNIKVGFLEEPRCEGIKIIRTFPGNTDRGLPRQRCEILVIDMNTGELKGVVAGVHITRIRTGSAGAVGARFLARPDARRVAVIGAGVQGEAQLEALAADRPLGNVKVWSRTAHRRQAYAVAMGQRLGLEIEPCASIETAVRDAEIIITATWAYEVLVSEQWIRPGTYIGAIGADGPAMQELDPALLNRAKVVVDDLDQCVKIGEINVPVSKGLYRVEQLHGTIAEICAGAKPGRENEREVTIFDSTGIGLQDVIAAEYVYRRGLELGLGRRVSM